MTITAYVPHMNTSTRHFLLLLFLLCDKEEHYKYIVYCVYAVCVSLDEMVYIIFIIYDIVELFNMHKSFSFYLNIKFFAHKILNALSFQWFPFFGYVLRWAVACYRIGRLFGWLVFRYHFVFCRSEWEWGGD